MCHCKYHDQLYVVANYISPIKLKFNEANETKNELFFVMAIDA